MKRLVLVALVLLIFSSSVGAGWQVASDEDAARALGYARKMVEVRYVYEGEEYQGMPYLLAGRSSVEDLLAGEKVPGVEVGLDASGVVVLAYRQAVEGLRFGSMQQGERRPVANLASGTLFTGSIESVEFADLRPGDLIFFGEAGRISGVGLFVESSERLVHFIVASASRGKVILTNLDLQGSYWRERFAGAGRLVYWTN